MRVSLATVVLVILLMGVVAPANADPVVSEPVTVNFYGMEVDKALAEKLEEYARANNLDLGEEFAESPVSNAAGDISFYASNRGGIEVPAGYIYNPSMGPLHDYCTNSPDQFPAPGDNADFSGACARHDMCYERTSRSDKNGMRTCDSNFRNDLMRVCEAVYTSNVDPRRNSCRSTALSYYAAVVTFHHNNYWS